MKEKIIICKVGTNADAYTIRDNCQPCRYRYSKRGEHWLDDVIKCICPISLRKGQGIKEIPAKYIKINKSDLPKP